MEPQTHSQAVANCDLADKLLAFVSAGEIVLTRPKSRSDDTLLCLASEKELGTALE